MKNFWIETASIVKEILQRKGYDDEQIFNLSLEEVKKAVQGTEVEKFFKGSQRVAEDIIATLRESLKRR